MGALVLADVVDRTQDLAATAAPILLERYSPDAVATAFRAAVAQARKASLI